MNLMLLLYIVVVVCYRYQNKVQHQLMSISMQNFGNCVKCSSLTPVGRGESNIKKVGGACRLVRGVNFRFWSRLGS